MKAKSKHFSPSIPPRSEHLFACALLPPLEIPALSPFAAERREKVETQPGKGALPTQGLDLLLSPPAEVG